MKITNEQNLPEALVKAVTTQRHNDPGRLSATTLLGGTKQVILTDRHWDELEDDVADRFWAIIGTAVHSVLEDEGKDEFTEEFISHEVDGIIVTGRIDNYNMRTGVISDYKSVSVWKIVHQDFEDWRKQGLIYAWLLQKNGFLVKTCRFIALLKDHSKREAKQKSGYPKKPMAVYEFEVTENGLTEIEAYIKEKVTDIKKNRELPDDGIPPCTAKERWDKPTKYAVYKGTNKRAFRVMDTIEEAEKLAADMGVGYSVVTRPGESTRCLEYCSCCDFCNFYQSIVQAAEEQDTAAA